MKSSFWSDFVSGLGGPAGGTAAQRRGRPATPIDPADALDTLTNLQAGAFVFDDDYEPVIARLDRLYGMGYLTTPPDLLRNGADIGHGRLLTEAGRAAIAKLQAAQP